MILLPEPQGGPTRIQIGITKGGLIMGLDGNGDTTLISPRSPAAFAQALVYATELIEGFARLYAQALADLPDLREQGAQGAQGEQPSDEPPAPIQPN